MQIDTSNNTRLSFRKNRFLLFALCASLGVHFILLLGFNLLPSDGKQEILKKTHRMAVTLVVPPKKVDTPKNTKPKNMPSDRHKKPSVLPTEKEKIPEPTREPPSKTQEKPRTQSPPANQKIVTTPKVSVGQLLSQIKNEEAVRYTSLNSSIEAVCTKKMKLSGMYKCNERDDGEETYAAGVAINSSHLKVRHSSMGGISTIERKLLLDKLETLEQLASNTDLDQTFLEQQRKRLTEEVNRLDRQQTAGGLIGAPGRALLKLIDEVRPVGHYNSKEK